MKGKLLLKFIIQVPQAKDACPYAKFPFHVIIQWWYTMYIRSERSMLLKTRNVYMMDAIQGCWLDGCCTKWKGNKHKNLNRIIFPFYLFFRENNYNIFPHRCSHSYTWKIWNENIMNIFSKKKGKNPWVKKGRKKWKWIYVRSMYVWYAKGKWKNDFHFCMHYNFSL